MIGCRRKTTRSYDLPEDVRPFAAIVGGRPTMVLTCGEVYHHRGRPVQLFCAQCEAAE